MAKNYQKMINTSNDSEKKSVAGADRLRPPAPTPKPESQGGSGDKK